MKKIILALVVATNISAVGFAGEPPADLDCSNINDIKSVVENKNSEEIMHLYYICLGQSQTLSQLTTELVNEAKLEKDDDVGIALSFKSMNLSFRALAARASSLNFLKIAIAKKSNE